MAWVYELVGEVIGHLSCDVQAGRRTCQASSLVQLESGFGWLNLSATADVIVEVPGVKPKSWIGCYMQILVAIHICPVLSPLSSSHFLISESNNLSCPPHGSYVHLSLFLYCFSCNTSTQNDPVSFSHNPNGLLSILSCSRVF